jgi:hypothetical protein
MQTKDRAKRGQKAHAHTVKLGLIHQDIGLDAVPLFAIEHG